MKLIINFSPFYTSKLLVCSLNSNYLPSTYLFAHNCDPSWRLQYSDLYLSPLFLIKGHIQLSYSLLSLHHCLLNSINLFSSSIKISVFSWQSLRNCPMVDCSLLVSSRYSILSLSRSWVQEPAPYSGRLAHWLTVFALT